MNRHPASIVVIWPLLAVLGGGIFLAPAIGQPRPGGDVPSYLRPSVAATPVSAEKFSDDDVVQILALVNGDPILASEVLPMVEDVLNANRDKIPPGQYEAQRLALIKQMLKPLVETKTLVSDAKANIPKEGMKNLEKNFSELFEEQELKKLYEKTKTDNKAALEAELKKFGTSLEKERRVFIEKTIAREWLRNQVKTVPKKEVTHDQRLAYYREHLAEYEFPAKARWQQITIRFGENRPKGEAYARVAELGNRILDGESFDAVAKKHSEGSTASTGGLQNWTTKGSLVSTVLDKALFSQPIGELSKTILEDQQGFHIIRVLERKDAGRTPFEEAQTEITKKIKEERFQAAVKEYIIKLKANTKVWTAFDTASATDVSASPRR